MTRFLCVGDLHLGAGGDYGRNPGDRLRDQEQVWRCALELAVEHDVDAVLFAGDAFHRRRPTPAEMLAFQRPLQDFTAEHKIDVVAIAGNHDCEAADLPTALDIFGRELDLHTRPHIQYVRNVAIATLPWSPVSRLVATRNGGDRDDLNREAAGLLVATARGLRDDLPAGQPAVLMLHWSISGASTPTGVATNDFREVVLDADELAGLGFDAIVAGHIHKAAKLPPFDQGPMFYTGSPAPVDFGEATTPHGCWLLDIEGGLADARFLPIESRPFVTLDVAYGEGDDFSMLTEGYVPFVEKMADAVVRVRYSATEEQARRIDHVALSRALYDAGAHKVYAIQPTILREARARVAGVDEDLAPLAALELWLDANGFTGCDEPEELARPSLDQAQRLRELTAGYLEAVTA